MKVSFDQQELLRVLKEAAKIVPNKPIRPIFAYARLNCNNNSCTLEATDLDSNLQIKFNTAEVEDTGEALLPVRLVMEVIRESNDDFVFVTSKDNTGIILSDSYSSFEFPTPDPAEYPRIPDFSSSSCYEMHPIVLRDMITRTSFAADPDNSNYSLAGVYFEFSDTEAYAVATDGRRMAIQRASVEYIGPEDEADKGTNALLPIKGLELLQKAINDNESLAETDKTFAQFAVSKNYAEVKVGMSTITLRLLEGRFPDWRKVLEKANVPDPTIAQIDASWFLSATRQVATTTDKINPGVVYELLLKNIVLSSETEVGKAKVELAIPQEGKKVSVLLDPKFVVDFLRIWDDETTVTWKVGGPATAVLFERGDDYKYLIMPMQPKSED